MKILLFVFTMCAFFCSCTTDRERILNEAEEILPGTWHIESLTLRADPFGTYYKGITFFSDTTLFNVGMIEIPEFTIDTLDSNSDINGKVRIPVIIEQEIFPFAIHHILPYHNNEDIFLNIERDLPPGTFIPETDAEKFMVSSFLLNGNYIISIINNDHLEMRGSQDFVLKRL